MTASRTGAARAAAASAFPGGGRGGRINIPMGGGRAGGFSFKTILFLVVIYFILKMLGIDLLQVMNQGGMPVPGGGTDSQITLPDARTEVTDNSGAAASPGNVHRRRRRRMPARNSWPACWAPPTASGSEIFTQMGADLPEAQAGAVRGLRAVGLRHGAIGHGPVLLPGRPEGLHRPQLLPGHEEQARRAGRFRAGLCDRA